MMSGANWGLWGGNVEKQDPTPKDQRRQMHRLEDPASRRWGQIVYQSVVTPAYFGMFSSEVSTVNPYACASATITRSNGSR